MFIGLKCSGYKLSRNIAITGLVIFLLSGFLAHLYIYPYFSSKDPMPFTEEMQVIQDVCKDGRIVRYFSENFKPTRARQQDYIFPSNLPAKYGIFDIFCHDSMMLGNYFTFYEKAAPGTIERRRVMLTLKSLDPLNPIALFVQASGLKYCLAKDEPVLENIFGEPVYDESMQIYELKTGGNPFAGFYGTYELETEYSNIPCKDDFRSKVILDSEPVLPDGRILTSNPQFGFTNSNDIKILRTSTTMEVDFNAPTDCILYISDTFHPRWHAKLDGEDIEMLQANYAFRAFTVPKGEHKIFMWYDGIDVLRGGIVSIIGLGLAFLTGILDIRSHSRWKNQPGKSNKT